MKYEVVDEEGNWHLRQNTPIKESQVKELEKLLKKKLRIHETSKE